MRKVIGVITARMASTRLPGKVLSEIAGKSNFAHHVERMRHMESLDGIFLATSKDPLNVELIEEAKRLGCGWYAGSEQDVVDRHIRLCDREKADAVLRVTCDCPLFDIDSASQFVRLFKKEYRDFIYVSNMVMMQGTLSELISHNALKEVHNHYKGAAISLYIRENLDQFKTLGIEIDKDLCRLEYRLTVDWPDDLKLIQYIYSALYKGFPLSLRDVYIWLDDNPEIAKINMHIVSKNVNLYAANLMEKPLYSITKSGGRYIILDEDKRMIDPMEFLHKLHYFFPELKK